MMESKEFFVQQNLYNQFKTLQYKIFVQQTRDDCIFNIKCPQTREELEHIINYCDTPSPSGERGRMLYHVVAEMRWYIMSPSEKWSIGQSPTLLQRSWSKMSDYEKFMVPHITVATKIIERPDSVARYFNRQNK